jgi:3-hydroxyisobutyrate dehydrogenase-like beta-hydroxyacid dehydrogenase
MERIGFVGLGTMGASMAANLLRAGARLTVWNRTPGKTAAAVELGAREAGSPGEVAAQSDVTVICVYDTPDVEAVLFGPDGIALALGPEAWWSTARRSRRARPVTSAGGWPPGAWAWWTPRFRAARKGRGSAR